MIPNQYGYLVADGTSWGFQSASLTLPHDHTAHEHLDRSDSLQWDFTLARCLVQSQLMSQLVFRDGIGMIDLVAEDEERCLGQVFHC